MVKRKASIKSVDYSCGVALFKALVAESLETGGMHDLAIRVEDKDLTLEKLVELFTVEEQEFVSDEDYARRGELAKEFLGKKFKIELEE